MASTVDFMNRLVPITQFNKGQASRIFDRVREERQIIVLKNNAPSAVIISPEEYERFSEMEENYHLLLEATERLERAKGEPTISMAESMAEFGITQEDLDAMEDPVIE